MKKEKFLHKYRFLIASVLTVVLFIAVWAFIVETGFVSTKYLPSPTQILDTFVQKLSDPKPEGSTLGANILSSVKVASVGFLLAVVLGITLGLFMGWYTPLEKFVKPVFEIIRPIPPVAWIPITIMLFGIGFKARALSTPTPASSSPTGRSSMWPRPTVQTAGRYSGQWGSPRLCR